MFSFIVCCFKSFCRMGAPISTSHTLSFHIHCFHGNHPNYSLSPSFFFLLSIFSLIPLLCSLCHHDPCKVIVFGPMLEGELYVVRNLWTHQRNGTTSIGNLLLLNMEF